MIDRCEPQLYTAACQDEGARVRRDQTRGRTAVAMAFTMAVLAAACEPTVRVEAPKEPITINLNIKLDADVRVQLEKEAKQDVRTKAIF